MPGSIVQKITFGGLLKNFKFLSDSGDSNGNLTSITTLQGIDGVPLTPAKTAQFPDSVGQKDAAHSLPVVLSSDGPFASNFGLQADTPATSDSGAASFISLFKRALAALAALNANSASYTSAGAYVASGSLTAPAGMPNGAQMRGVGWLCDGTVAANSVVTVTLAGGGTRKIVLQPNSSGSEGLAAVSVSAVPGATFQGLY